MDPVCVNDDFVIGEIMQMLQPMDDSVVSQQNLQQEESMQQHPSHQHLQQPVNDIIIPEIHQVGGSNGNLSTMSPQYVAPVMSIMATTSGSHEQLIAPQQTRTDRIAFQQTRTDPWTEIVEEPRSKGFRFRYESEGRLASGVTGANSTNDNKTYPTIKIHNHSGPAIIVVSCVSKDLPPGCKPHPHSIVGKDSKKGVLTLKVTNSKENIIFQHIGIQCVKINEIEAAMKLRQEIQVDPFRTGYDNSRSQIDLNALRLCFQIFLPNCQGKCIRPITPVVSQVIHDKKSSKNLTISRVDKTSGSVHGGDEVFLLCDKVNKENIKIKFFEEDNDGQIIWEEYGDFGLGDVHHQVAIVFRAPPYHNPEITSPVDVNMQLYRPSDGETSESRSFTYIPYDPDPYKIEEKKKRKLPVFDDYWNIADSSENKTGASGDSVRGRLSSKLKGFRGMKKKTNCPQGMLQYPTTSMCGASASFNVTDTADSSSISSVPIPSTSANITNLRLIDNNMYVVSADDDQLVHSAPGICSTENTNLSTLSGEFVDQTDTQPFDVFLQSPGSESQLSLSRFTSQELIALDGELSQHIFLMDTAELEADENTRDPNWSSHTIS